MSIAKKPIRVSLRALLTRYFSERDLSPKYRQQIEWTVRYLREWHDQIVYVDDFSDEFVNRYLVDLLASGVAKNTAKNRRRMILTLWRYAFELELLERQPRRVRKIATPLKIPEAWSADEVRQLLVAVDTLCKWHKHRTCKVPTRRFWRALIMAAWDTGLRKIDLGKLRRSDIGADGTIIIIQGKTGWPVRCTLRPETVEAIDATIPDNRPLIFGDGGSRRARTFQMIVKGAGLKGGFHKLRRSSATAVEVLSPGAAMAHLGHKTPGLAARHYVDPRHTQDTKTRPPSLSQPVEQPKPTGDILAWL